MKKLLFLFFLILIGCQKEYTCTETVTTTVDNIQVSQVHNTLYCKEDLTNSDCFNYVWQSNDTIIITKTTCK
jgi:hypothetical protein